MWKKTTGWLFEVQKRNGILEEKDRRLYEYAYGVLLGRVAIYLITVILGIATGNWLEMLVFLLPFTVLRQYAGGIHLEKAGSCMIVSSILVLLCSQYLACILPERFGAGSEYVASEDSGLRGDRGKTGAGIKTSDRRAQERTTPDYRDWDKGCCNYKTDFKCAGRCKCGVYICGFFKIFSAGSGERACGI